MSDLGKSGSTGAPGPTGEAPPRLDPMSKLECRICWHVYDPARGDDVWQIPPGTAFLDLPDYWRCPECDSAPGAFLPIEA